MSKAKKKVTKVVENTQEVVSPIKGTDLSVQKRIELFNNEYTAFMEKMKEQYGLTIGVELVYAKQGTVPRQVLVDLMATAQNQNEQNQDKK